MDLADKIDPAEVLAHLNQMGYRNITPIQLKEFIRDLKKLIVYDHLSSSSGSLTSLSSSVTSDSEYFSTSETSSDHCRVLSNLGSHSKPTFTKHRKAKDVNTAVFKAAPKASTASTLSASTLRRSSTSSSSIALKSSLKENVPLRKGRTKSMSEDDLQEAMKPKTSFIRPWQLQGMQSGSGRSGRSDPVSLYHYYQALWAQRKCPGEDSHADLRWVIREKMLGQDPHLYSQNTLVAAKRGSRLRM